MTEAYRESLIDFTIYQYLLTCFQFFQTSVTLNCRHHSWKASRVQITEEDFGLKKKVVTEDAEKLLQETLINFGLIIMPIKSKSLI